MTDKPPTPDELRLAQLAWRVMNSDERRAFLFSISWECPRCHRDVRLGRRVRRGRHRGWCWLCAHRARTDARTAAVSARKRRARADRKCEGCGTLFTPARSDGRFCSNACRQAMYRKRKTK